jgi:ketosteroid isomerase-like protein
MPMPDLTPAQQQSLDIVKAFYAAKERRDLDATVSFFADDIVYVFPLNSSGEPEPWFVFDGKDATREYQRGVLARFSRVHMVDPEYTVSPDGDRVFVTARGDYIQEQGRKPYNNVYVFRFAIADGKIQRVDEYANPVTFAKLAGLPIG